MKNSSIATSMLRSSLLFSFFTSALLLVLGQVQLNGQTNPDCIFVDPLITTADNDPFAYDPCCGQAIVNNVCYNLPGTPTLSALTTDLILVGFTYPSGSWSGNYQGTPQQIATFMTTQSQVNVPFEYSSATHTICANGVDSLGFGNLEFKDPITAEITYVIPIEETVNECPIDPQQIIADMLNDGAPENLVFIGTDSITLYTNDVVNSIQVDSSAGTPNGNQVGNILNGLINSGALSAGYFCDGPNINCYGDDLTAQIESDEWGNFLTDSIGIDSLLPDTLPAGFNFQDELAANWTQFLSEVENDHGSLAGYLNSIFTINFPDVPCGEAGGGNLLSNGGKPTANAFNQALKSSSSGEQTSADLNFFNDAIPGLGTGGGQPSTPSPTAQSLIESVQSGVDLYNGSNSLAIPLHTIVANDINIPISLSSGGNGLKIDDLGSLVGQHWQLNAGGMITRVVNGLPDEYNGTVKGMGVGRANRITPRLQLFSNLGLGLNFPNADQVTAPICLADSTRGIWAGASLTPLEGLGLGEVTLYDVNEVDDEGELIPIKLPVKLNITWSALEPGMINITLSIPIFRHFGFTVYLEVGFKGGWMLNETLSHIVYEERGIGHMYIDGETVGDTQVFGLSTLDEDYLSNLSDDEKAAYLQKIHPNRRFDDAAFLSNPIATYGAWIEALSLFGWDDYDPPVYKTEQLDLKPDEFYFSAGGYSGKFYLDMDGIPQLVPYQAGVEISSPIFDATGKHLAGFTISTPDGLIYEFGSAALDGVDFTDNTSFMLPNMYTYPELDGPGWNRDHFGTAQLDLGVISHQPFLGRRQFKTYTQTYDHNYKVMESPRHSSAWHLLSIKSQYSQEEVLFDYEKQDPLTYYANKSYSHSFPNFAVSENYVETQYGGHLNPFRFGPTKWENGRAEFTYQATQTDLVRHDLIAIRTNRGERADFIYEEGGRSEIAFDHILKRIEIRRDENADINTENIPLYKGWELEYETTSQGTVSATCSDSITGPVSPVSVSGGEEARFHLGSPYDMSWYEFHDYFFLTFRVACLKLPVQLPIGFLQTPEFINSRTEMSEFSSLMEIKGRPDPFNVERFPLDLSKEEAIFQAEQNRTFLNSIKGIGSDNDSFAFITQIEYINETGLPKRFSVHQDVYGYYSDNSVSGSPLPPVAYESILGTNVTSLSDGMKHHFPFYNLDLPSSQLSMHLGQNETMQTGEEARGALRGLQFVTGATVLFGYEPNVFPDGTRAGGWRVTGKVEQPGDTPAKTTSYRYEQPTVINYPIRYYTDPYSQYFDGLEQKVSTSSSPMNRLLSNGSNLVGYGKVTENWDDIGRVTHEFTTPDNYSQLIESAPEDTIASINISCFQNTYGNSTGAFSTVCFDVAPEIDLPSDPFLHCGGLFGLEVTSSTYNNDNALINRVQNKYERYFPLERESDGVRMFDSRMSQYNHRGTHNQIFFHRNLTNFLPFERGGITNLIDLIYDIFLGTVAPHPYRYVRRDYQLSNYIIPSCAVRSVETSSTSYPLGGNSSFSSLTVPVYFENLSGKENLVDRTTTTYSDGIVVDQYFGYAFEVTDNTLQQFFDAPTLTYLRNIDYNAPLHSFTRTNGVLTNHSFTSLKRYNSRVVPWANYSLQFPSSDANISITPTLRGFFDDYTSDGLPETYYQAEYGTALGDPLATHFFEPISLEWNNQRQITSRSFLDYTTTNNYNSFFELSGTIDVNGVTNSYAYDARRRLSVVSANSGLTVSAYTYNEAPGNNFIETTTTIANAPTQMLTEHIDGFGKMKRQVRGDGAVLSSVVEYDNFWRPVITSDLKMGEIINTYAASPASELLETEDAEGNIYEYKYFGSGTSDSITYFTAKRTTDPNGSRSTEYHNSLNIYLGIKQEHGSKAGYGYDAYWRLRTIVNGIGDLYTYNYNDQGMLYSTKVPGSGTRRMCYDERYRQVAAIDANGNLIVNQFDTLMRPEKTYLLGGGLPGSQGVANYATDIVPLFDTNELLSERTYDVNRPNYLRTSNDRILDFADSGEFVFSDYINIDTLGRPTEALMTYPDATVHQFTTFDGIGNILNTQSDIDHYGYQMSVHNTFDFDEVLRPVGHSIVAGNAVAEVNKLFYDSRDNVKVKLVGNVAGTNDFLQQVDYYYDNISRLIAINSFGGYECNENEVICKLDLEFSISGRQVKDDECVRLASVIVGGQNHPLIPGPIGATPEVIGQYIVDGIEEALHAYGYTGTVSMENDITATGYTYTITVDDTNAGAIELVFLNCTDSFVFTTGDCCTPVTVPNDGSGENYALVGNPTNNPDLYYQTMEYNGIDISQIEIGSECTYGRMINNYTYDKLHRVTNMENILFRPDPIANAYSTSYSYDPAGNIQTLTRQGFVGLDQNGAPQFDLIDDLVYTYNGGVGELSILNTVQDSVTDPAHQPFGFSPTTANYVPDANGNMTTSGDVTLAYNLLNLPEYMSDGQDDIYQDYVSSGQKYRKEGPDGSGGTEVRFYLAGVEFVDSLPQTYNFGDGRVYWETPTNPNEAPKHHLQYRLTDHLGNTMVFFEDKDEDGLLTTELDMPAQPEDLEVIQRLWYYPFGMDMEGIGQAMATPGQVYRYNGKELDEATGLYEYGFRWYDPAIGRFTGVDPIADQFAWVSVFNYAENRPIDGIDLHGLQYVNINDIDNLESTEMASFLKHGQFEPINYKGQTYYRVGMHLNDNEGNQVTSWIYTPIKSVIKREDYVGYGATGDCFSACELQVGKVNRKITPYWTDGIQMYKKGTSGLSVSQSSKLAGIDAINSSLENGNPIVVGVDYENGSPGNIDGTTDHWITITGRNNDGDGEYFTFFENAIGLITKGTNPDLNKLYLQEDGTLRGTSSWYNENFTVTVVRPTTENN